MVEPLPPRTTVEPVEPTAEVARKNVRLAWLLVVVALAFAAGAVIVSLIYLQYD